MKPLIVILFTAAVLRIYNLMHDAPYFFNPDERNMAGAITRFVLPAKFSEIPKCIFSEFTSKNLPAKNYQLETDNCTLNPHFFAYGQFPLYLAYLSDSFLKAPLFALNANQAGRLATDLPAAPFWLPFLSALS